MKLIPTTRTVDLRYDCPNCEDHPEMWLTEKEAGVSGFKVVCPMCERVYEIEPIDINVTIRPKRKKSISTNHRWNDPKIIALTGMYSKGEIEKAIYDLKIAGKCPYSDEDIKAIIIKMSENRESVSTY